MQLEQLTLLGSGVNLDEIIGRYDTYLDEPLPDEVSAEEYEMRRRRKIALENQASLERLSGVTRMDRARDARQWAGGERPSRT